jgi:hypothetical protein
VPILKMRVNALALPGMPSWFGDQLKEETT